MKDRIDIDKIVGIDRKGRLRRARRVAAVLQADWQARAPNARYARGVRVTAVEPDRVELALQGLYPNLREQGMGPGGIGTQGSYDVRQFVLKPGTKSLKFGKNGMYVSIPFEHSKGSIRDAGGAGALRAAKALKASLSRPGGGGTKWGERLGAQFGSRLQGLTRMEKTYAAATQSTFRTWRTMSQGGRPWMSRGVKALHIARDVVGDLGKTLAGV